MRRQNVCALAFMTTKLEGPLAAVAENVVQDLEDLSRHGLGLCGRRYPDLLAEVPGTPADLELEAFQQCRFSAGRDPGFSKPFPPDLSSRLSARAAR
jgi:hypothetical protein